MTQTASAEFDSVSWEEHPYLEPEEGPRMVRGEVGRVWRGDLEGRSTAVLLMSQSADGSAGYVASERFEGALGGRKGSFVMHHSNIMGGDAPPEPATGYVVPGSGRGALTGLTGKCTWVHRGDEHLFTLTYELAD
ncbi:MULTISPECIES: DUF3224 domain-containing protein [unclassified Streptomyces]|uniref:DUF3224 domain-containing protein n=1 Tax=unclassified Streptomyces TaxID=2593676 RepID=UPI002E2C720B|nr:DUF3224 domain-containing protein [Streptomyces sp. NBC_00441]